MAGKQTVPGGLSFKDVAPDLSVLGESVIARVGGVLQVSADGTPYTQIGGGNPWATARQAVLNAAVPGLSWQYVKPTNIQPATDAVNPTIDANDAGIEGGGRTPASAHVLTFTGGIYTDLTTKRHAWSFRGRFSAVEAGGQFVGVSNAAFNETVNLCARTSIDATHLVLQLSKNGGTTNIVTSHVVDGNPHNYSVSFNGTTYVAYVDDVAVGNTSVLTNLTAGARAFFAYNATTGNVFVSDITYGYVLV